MFRYGVAKHNNSTKEAADAFETVIGLFKRERGAQGVEDWAWEYFGPIVFAAWEVWDELQYVDATRFKYRISPYDIPCPKAEIRIPRILYSAQRDTDEC